MKRKTWMRCLFWLGLSLTIFGAITWLAIPYIESVRVERISKELTDKYGLVVCYGDPSEFRVPPFKAITDSDGIHIEQADKHYVLTALKGVKSALAKYPPALVRKYLSAVFVTGLIKDKNNNIKALGTYQNSWIYVSASRPNPLDPGLYAETIHHELSSLFFYGPLAKSLPLEQSTLFSYGPYSTPLYDPGVEPIKAPKFPSNRWSNINVPGFEYPEQDADFIRAIKTIRNSKEAPLWYKDGFVIVYGMSSMENDFNTYAAIAMENPEKLKKLAEQYPRIAAKTRLLVEFYTALAPELGEYFKSVGLYNIKAPLKTR